jgi:hypothetical protein
VFQPVSQHAVNLRGGSAAPHLDLSVCLLLTCPRATPAVKLMADAGRLSPRRLSAFSLGEMSCAERTGNQAAEWGTSPQGLSAIGLLLTAALSAFGSDLAHAIARCFGM